MKLISKNNNIQKYNIPAFLIMDDSYFYGHQSGILACIKNNKTGEIEKISLEMTEAQITEMLADPEITLFTRDITQFVEGNVLPVHKTMYFLPYLVEGHSSTRPTVTDKNIESGYHNTWYEAEIEILFVTEDGLTRYITVKEKTNDIGIFNLIQFAMNSNSGIEKLLEHIPDFYKKRATHEEPGGYCLTFYEENGLSRVLTFESGSDLKNAISSIRLIGLKEIEK